MVVEADRWVDKHRRFCVRSKDYIQGLERVFGASRSLPGMDGAEHYRMRKSRSAADSRVALAPRLPE